jgi:hypothetical protein
MSKILITLPLDRTQVGTLRVLADDGSTQFGPVIALGKSDNETAAAHGNTARDSTLSYGDTPLGNYDPATTLGGVTVPDMGPVIIPLNGISGDALTAKENGRSGLAIHAGRGDDGGPYEGLFPTDGCVRLAQSDMNNLVSYMGTTVYPISIVPA